MIITQYLDSKLIAMKILCLLCDCKTSHLMITLFSPYLFLLSEYHVSIKLQIVLILPWLPVFGKLVGLKKGAE